MAKYKVIITEILDSDDIKDITDLDTAKEAAEGLLSGDTDWSGNENVEVTELPA